MWFEEIGIGWQVGQTYLLKVLQMQKRGILVGQHDRSTLLLRGQLVSYQGRDSQINGQLQTLASNRRNVDDILLISGVLEWEDDLVNDRKFFDVVHVPIAAELDAADKHRQIKG